MGQPTGVEHLVRVMDGVLGFHFDDPFALPFERGQQPMKSSFRREPAHAVGAERHETFLPPFGRFTPRVPRQVRRVAEADAQKRLASGGRLPQQLDVVLEVVPGRPEQGVGVGQGNLVVGRVRLDLHAEDGEPGAPQVAGAHPSLRRGRRARRRPRRQPAIGCSTCVPRARTIRTHLHRSASHQERNASSAPAAPTVRCTSKLPRQVCMDVLVSPTVTADKREQKERKRGQERKRGKRIL